MMQMLRACIREFRFAVRRLLSVPTFSIAAILSIAVGIGAAGSIFAMAYGILLRPLPYPDTDRIVAVEHQAPRRGLYFDAQSEPLYANYRRSTQTLEVMGSYAQNVVNLSDRDAPEQITISMVSPTVFTTLGTRAHRGRLFSRTDGMIGAETVLIMEYGLWQTRYGGDESIVGKTVEVNGRQREVIGIAPPGFAFPNRDVKLWYNLSPEPAQPVRDMTLGVIAKVRDGVPLTAVREDLRRSLQTLVASSAGADRDFLSELEVAIVPLKDKLVGNLRPALLILFAAGTLLFIVACGGVVNLFLVRFERSQQSLAVRGALGARRIQLVAVWLTEAVIVTLLGGLLGMQATVMIVQGRFGLQPGEIPRLEDVRVDAGTVIFVIGLLVLVCVSIGTAVAIRSRHVQLGSSLGPARANDLRPAQQRLQRSLLVVQVALALVSLLAGATAVRGFQRLMAVKLGFVADNVVTQKIALPFRTYNTYALAAAFHGELARRLTGLPGVVSVGSVSALPVTAAAADYQGSMAVTGQTTGTMPPDQSIPAQFVLATPAYFSAMRIPLVAGTMFQASENATVVPVMVGRSLARQLAGTEGAAPGLTLRDVKRPSFQFAIAGVVEDTATEHLAGPPRHVLYLPVLEGLSSTLRIPLMPSQMTVVVRTSANALAAATSVKAIIRGLDPKLPVSDVQTMVARVDGARAHLRLAAILLTVAAITTLFLGIIGVYGVTAYAVSRRTREFGVRLALGATPSTIQRLIASELAWVVAIGVTIGAAVFLAFSSFLRGIAAGVEPASVTAIASAIAIVILAAFCAGFGPALRAGRVDAAKVTSAL
jgi:putative ABC transport system permease protein